MPIPRSLGDTEHEVAAALASMSASPPRFSSPAEPVRKAAPASRPGAGAGSDNQFRPTGQVESNIPPSEGKPAPSDLDLRTPPATTTPLPRTPPSLDRKSIKFEPSVDADANSKPQTKPLTPSKTPKTPKRAAKPYARPARKSASKAISLINETPSESPPNSRLTSPEARFDSPTPRSTTRGRKLKPITDEEIKDLAPDEQVHVKTYSVKYQHKAATLFRALRDPNCHRITSKTILKPCETCTSQDWPCMLEVTNAFGLRKAVSRCTGCRHTRSTCSLKNQVKDWAEDDPRMPWENEDGTPRDSSREPSCIPELRRGKSWSASLPPAELDVVPDAPDAQPFSAPVALHLPPNVDANISNFLYTMEPVLHHLPPSTSAAISALIRSVGGQHSAAEPPAPYSRPASPTNGNFDGPPRPPGSWEMNSFAPREDDVDPFYPPPLPSTHYPRHEYRPSYHPYHDRHEHAHSAARHTSPYTRGDRTPSYRYPSTESPSGLRLGTPLVDPAHDYDSMPPPSWRASSYDALDLDMGSMGSMSARRHVVPQIVVHPHSPCAVNDKPRTRYYSPRPDTPTPVRFRGSGPHDIEDVQTLLELGQSRSLSLPVGAGHRDTEYRDRSASPVPEARGAGAAPRRPYWRTNA